MFLQAFPTLMCHIYRWRLVDHSLKFSTDYMGLEGHLLYSLGIYAAWQIGYLVMTGEIAEKRSIFDWNRIALLEAKISVLRFLGPYIHNFWGSCVMLKGDIESVQTHPLLRFIVFSRNSPTDNSSYHVLLAVSRPSVHVTVIISTFFQKWFWSQNLTRTHSMWPAYATSLRTTKTLWSNLSSTSAGTRAL